MIPDFILGIDPGLSGGIAVLGTRLGTWSVLRMPTAGGEIDAGEIAETLSGLRSGGMSLMAVVEKVGAMPKQGLSSTFKFGCGYGMVRGALAAHGVPTHLVTPQAWKAKVLAGTAKDKDAAVDYVRRVHPSVPLIPAGCRVPHDGIADAVCLATYGRLALTA